MKISTAFNIIAAVGMVAMTVWLAAQFIHTAAELGSGITYHIEGVE